MAVSQRIDEAAYARLVLDEPNNPVWELVDGVLREKPGMTWDHGSAIERLTATLVTQLDPRRYRVWTNMARLRIVSGTYYVPDVAVIPDEMGADFRGRADALPIFADPLPLVVEIWSPSTGRYDVETKIPDYLRRGDAEVWRIHPFERTLTAWRRQPDGSYLEAMHRDGVVVPASLPGVALDLAALFGG